MYNFEVIFEAGEGGHPYVRKWGTDEGGCKIGPREILFLIKA